MPLVESDVESGGSLYARMVEASAESWVGGMPATSVSCTMQGPLLDSMYALKVSAAPRILLGERRKKPKLSLLAVQVGGDWASKYSSCVGTIHAQDSRQEASEQDFHKLGLLKLSSFAVEIFSIPSQPRLGASISLLWSWNLHCSIIRNGKLTQRNGMSV